MPKILVTGGTGFAGSHLIEALRANGYTDVYSTTYSAVDQAVAFLPPDHYIQVDLSDEQSTMQLIEHIKPEWVFHLAAFAYVGKSFEKARELFANNINLQLNVLEAIRIHCPSARILTIGSAEEYGIQPDHLESIDESCLLNPVNPYAVSKVTQDLLAASYYLSYKLNVIRARPFNHLGIRQTGDFAIPAFAAQIVAIERGAQKTLQVGNLKGIRDFTSVKDVVEAYIVLMQKGEVGKVYNIGFGKGYTMTEIVEKLCSLSTAAITIEEDPARMRPLDVPKLIANNETIRALGWQPKVPIEQELKNVLEEWRKKS